MTGERLFDVEGLAADVELTLGPSPIARPARVGFLAGMLSTWVLGPGVKPTEAESERFRTLARESLAQAYLHARPSHGKDTPPVEPPPSILIQSGES